MKIGPKYKICRRLGDRVFSKCQTTKFTVSGTNRKRQGKRRTNVSEYGLQLLEKQKARYTYGVNEKQFSNYIKEVRAKKDSTPTEDLFRHLESRLDNIVYRAGLAHSRMFARQMVSHGHIMVNGRRVTIPSYRMKKGDKFSVRPQSADKRLFAEFEERKKDIDTPTWIKFDPEKKAGEIIDKPALKDEVSTLNLQAILEFYSRV